LQIPTGNDKLKLMKRFSSNKFRNSMDHHLIYKGNENRKKMMEFSGKINELFSY